MTHSSVTLLGAVLALAAVLLSASAATTPNPNANNNKISPHIGIPSQNKNSTADPKNPIGGSSSAGPKNPIGGSSVGPNIANSSKAPKPSTNGPKPVSTNGPKPVSTNGPKPVSTNGPKPSTNAGPAQVSDSLLASILPNDTVIHRFTLPAGQKPQLDGQMLNDWYRLTNGSLHVDTHHEAVLKPWTKLSSVLKSLCEANGLRNECVHYFKQYSKDLDHFTEVLGKTLKYYDKTLLRLRQDKVRRGVESPAVLDPNRTPPTVATVKPPRVFTTPSGVVEEINGHNQNNNNNNPSKVESPKISPKASTNVPINPKPVDKEPINPKPISKIPVKHISNIPKKN